MSHTTVERQPSPRLPLALCEACFAQRLCTPAGAVANIVCDDRWMIARIGTALGENRGSSAGLRAGLYSGLREGLGEEHLARCRPVSPLGELGLPGRLTEDELDELELDLRRLLSCRHEAAPNTLDGKRDEVVSGQLRSAWTRSFLRAFEDGYHRTKALGRLIAAVCVLRPSPEPDCIVNGVGAKAHFVLAGLCARHPDLDRLVADAVGISTRDQTSAAAFDLGVELRAAILGRGCGDG